MRRLILLAVLCSTAYGQVSPNWSNPNNFSTQQLNNVFTPYGYSAGTWVGAITPGNAYSACSAGTYVISATTYVFIIGAATTSAPTPTIAFPYNAWKPWAAPTSSVPTGPDCMWAAAQYQNDINGAAGPAAVVHIGPGAWNTCGGFSETPQASGWPMPSIYGEGKDVTTINQTCTISQPTVFYAEGITSYSSPHVFSGFTIRMQNNSTGGLVDWAGNQNGFVNQIHTQGSLNTTTPEMQFGKPGGSGFSTQDRMTYYGLYAEGAGFGGSSWATGTVSLSGSTPVITITSGGLYKFQNLTAYLVGFDAGGQECATQGTFTVTTTASGGNWTLATGTSSVVASGTWSCSTVAGASIFIPDLSPQPYGIDFAQSRVQDSYMIDIRASSIGTICAIRASSANNSFYWMHPFVNYCGFLTLAGPSPNHVYGMDTDTNIIAIDDLGPLTTDGIQPYYGSNAAFFTGAVGYRIHSGAASSVYGSDMKYTSTLPTNWHMYSISGTGAGTGPTDATSPGVFPVPLSINYNGQLLNTPTRLAYAFCSGTASSSTTISMFGLGNNQTACTGGPTTGAGLLMGTAGYVANLTMRCGTTGVSGASGVLTLYDQANGSASRNATALTLTYGTATANTPVIATGTFAYAAGDLLSISITTQATETLAACTVSFNY